jgi:hypothetical protein
VGPFAAGASEGALNPKPPQNAREIVHAFVKQYFVDDNGRTLKVTTFSTPVCSTAQQDTAQQGTTHHHHSRDSLLSLSAASGSNNLVHL